ncbi:MAG: ATP-grasp domain-containing protein [Desulfobacterales bacterium]|nr:ATP-grasp domain-containing protein [Desulfobacterales bacterium]
MNLISFDTMRSLGIKGMYPIKPEDWFREKDKVKKADWILFPEYWQVNALVYSLKKKIFPSINTYHLAHNKIEMTRAIQAIAPENVPYTKIFPKTELASELILEEFNFPFVAKIIRSCRGSGVFLIENKADLIKYINDNDILYIQEYLQINRDLRIVFIGNSAIASYWRIAQNGCFHNNVSKGAEVCFDDIPQKAIELVENISKATGINYAGFDVAEVDGNFYIFEFNLRFGASGLQERGINMGAIILKYLEDNSIAPLDNPGLAKAV